jgi:hypothetical protein
VNSNIGTLESYALEIINDDLNLESVKICYAGQTVAINADPDRMIALKLQLGHLTLDQDAEASISFIEFDSRKPFPFQIKSQYFEEDHIKFWFLPSFDLALLKISGKKQSLVFYRNGNFPNTSDSLRLIFQILIGSEFQPIHGGSISWGNSSVLVSNIGGSGKSSLIAASILNGAKTTGDDFGLFNIENDKIILWSQFQTLKLARSSPTRSLIKSNSLYSTQNKEVFSIDSIAKGAMNHFHEVDKLIIPKLGARPQLIECSIENALNYVLPSSSILSYSKTTAVRQLTRMCELLPAFVFKLGPNSIENSEFLKDKISE